MSDGPTETPVAPEREDDGPGHSAFWTPAIQRQWHAAYRAAGGLPAGYVYTSHDEKQGVAPPPPRPPIQERISTLERLAEAEARSMCMAVGMGWAADFSPESMRRYVVLESAIEFLKWVRAHEAEVARLIREIRDKGDRDSKR